MAWVKATRFTYWSYSAWTTWVQCAFKAKLKSIDKLKEPGSPALDNGNVVHKEGEDYLKGNVARFPASFAKFKKDMVAFKKKKAVAEVSWAFTKDWVRCSGTDWANAWVRVKIDLHYYDPAARVLYIRDYKTGKDKSDQDDNKDQLELYALVGMLMYPEAAVIDCQLWYVDHGTWAASLYNANPKAVKALKKAWERRVAPMLGDTVFTKSPSRLCNWCHFRASNGGPCNQG